MTKRRRNFFVLALVLALLAGSALVISQKRTVLGLDLKGGTELVYQGLPSAKVPQVTGEDIDRSIEIIRERVDSLGVSEPEITRLGEAQIAVGLPDVQDADRATEQIGTTAQLYFYDWEENVIPPDPDLPNPEDRGYNRLVDAVEAASEEKPLSETECNEQGCSHSAPLLYLFDSDTLQPLGEPAQRESDLRAQFPNDKLPDNSRVVEVPPGTVVVQDKPPDDPDTDADESETGTSEFFVLHDRPGLSGDEIRNPEQQFDQTTNQPNVTFDFTDEGKEAFQEVTRTIATRGQQNYVDEAGFGPPPDAQTASQFSDSFAIVLDNELVSRPIINFVENPDGIDGRTGAQISGLDSLTEAQDLAEVLRIGALPIRLALISQSTVSATLGQ